MENRGVTEVIHYLDDYFLFRTPGSEECSQALQASLELCNTPGLRIADHKVDGPSTSIPFLGILIDTAAGVLKLPQDKLTRLKTLLSHWRDCRKR